MSLNEPGSRISSNLRTPDHLGWISGPEKFRFFFRTEIVFFDRFSSVFEVFQAQEHSQNDPERFRGKRVSPIFVDFRRIFRGVARFSSKIVIIHGNSWCIMMHHDASWCIMMHHDAPWCIMMHHDASWCIVMHHDASWCVMRHRIMMHGYAAQLCGTQRNSTLWWFMTIHAESWWIMMHHDASWCIMMHHDASWWIMMHHDESWWSSW